MILGQTATYLKFETGLMRIDKVEKLHRLTRHITQLVPSRADCIKGSI